MGKRQLIIAILIASIAAAAIGTSDRGGLAYFSPDTLEYYTQAERTLFATGIPWYRSKLQQTENPLIIMLVDADYVAPLSNANSRFETIFHWNDCWRDGHGALYGVFHRDRDDVMQWTRENPECARLYWTEGFRLLRSDSATEVQAGREVLGTCWRFNNLDAMKEAIHQIYAENQIEE